MNADGKPLSFREALAVAGLPAPDHVWEMQGNAGSLTDGLPLAYATNVSDDHIRIFMTSAGSKVSR